MSGADTMTDWRPTIVLVGGFLGAGKTSLILSAARILEQRGVRAAVLLNDQGEELVDTRLAGLRGVTAREVTGGCFCCRFSDLAAAIDSLREQRPDVIFAEPVGSCTDLAATVLGPLREEFERYRIAPFTVLVDPQRAEAMRGNDADPDLNFLFENQLREADLVCMSKADLYPQAENPDTAGRWPGAVMRRISSVTGSGVEGWLDEILGDAMQPGMRTLEIDYARYAQAEAALAWVNLRFQYVPAVAAAPAEVAGQFLDALVEELTAGGIEIVHLKLIDSASSGWVKAALCGKIGEPSVEGTLDASPAGHHELLLNLRALADPAQIQAILETQLRRLPGEAEAVRLDSFSPAAPVPERRIASSRGPHL